MKKKLLLIILFMMLPPTVLADYSIGPSLGGVEWSGNCSHDITTQDNSGSNVFAATWYETNSNMSLGNLNGQNGWYSGVTYAAQVVSSPYISSQRAVEINDTGAGENTIYNSFDPLIKGNITLYTRFDDNSSGDKIEIRLNQASTTRIMFGMWSGTWKYFEGGSLIDSGVTAEIDTWYQIRCDFNMTSDTASYYVRKQTNNSWTLLGADKSIYSSDSNISQIRLRGGDGSTVKYNFDDIRVFTQNTGNLTTWHDALSGNETNNMVINVTGNWSGYYRQNATGNFVSHVSNQLGNQSIAISGFQFTDYQVQLLDGDDQKLFGITFNTQVTGTPTPTNLGFTRGHTWVNWTWGAGSGNVTDSYNRSINGSWGNGSSSEYYNHTGLSSGDHSEIILYAWNSTYNELSSGYVTNNVSTLSAPIILTYYPTVTIWPEVTDSQLFNVTVDQSTQCRWYINGSLEQTNATPSSTHAYTNTSLKGGHWNFTAVVNNTNGTDSQIWIFEVGADSFTYIVLQDQPTNKSMIGEINVTRIGSNVTDWGRWQNHTYSGWDYTFRYTNGTAIKSLTASYNNESLWFNGTTLLPTGVYFINATEAAVNTSTIIIPINSYGMINNWTSATTFSNIAANESNDVCYTYYNVTDDEWHSHYVGYSWNSDYVIPLEASTMMFVNAQTTVTATIITPANTNLYTGWNMLFVEGTDNESIADIKTDIGANCSDVWWFNSTAGDYSNTGTDTVQPCQGILPYITQNFTWTRSDL